METKKDFSIEPIEIVLVIGTIILLTALGLIVVWA